MRLLVLRPEPGASATLAKAAARGLDAIAMPLFAVAPVAWAVPDAEAHDALLLTSANAVRHGGAGLIDLRSLPVCAVGAATAAAAREYGLKVILIGEGGVEQLVPQMTAAGVRRPLHLAGAAHRTSGVDEAGLTRRIVYRADPVDRLADPAISALKEPAIALLHSPRSAALFATLVDQAGLDRHRLAIAAISPATASAAGAGWAAIVVSPVPTDDALLAAAAGLCETGGQLTKRERE